MVNHSFSDFSYAVNATSAKKGYKEILVCFIYNGVEVLRKVYIPEKEGTSYVFEAKKIIDQEMKSGVLASYSYKFVRRQEAGKPNWKWIGITAGIAALVIAGMSVGMYFVGKNSAANDANIFKVSFTSPDCRLTSGEDRVQKNAQYTCEIETYMANYEPVINQILVGSNELPSEKYNYDVVTHTLNITEGCIDGNVVISAFARPERELIAYPSFKVESDGSATITGLKDVDDKQAVTKIFVTNTVTDDAGNKYEVKKIEKAAFAGCGNLEEISLPFVGMYKELPEGINEDNQLFGIIFGDIDYTGGDVVYQEYTTDKRYEIRAVIPHDLSNVTITSSNEIVKGAFSKCTHINEIVFKNGVSNQISKFPNYAFYKCTALESVIYPDTIKEIGAHTFEDCSSLTELDLSNITTISANGLANCVGIQQIYIPSTMQTIKENALAGFIGLVLIQDNEATIASKKWPDNWVSTTAGVVYDSKSVEKITDSTHSFVFVITKKDNIEYAYITQYIGINSGEVIIPDALSPTASSESYPVGYLGSTAFYEFNGITKVTFNCSQLKSIGNYCFATCTILETLDGLKNSTQLSQIGVGAFYGCKNLLIDDTLDNPEQKPLNPTFPTSLTQVGDHAFKGCASLKKVDLYKVTKLGASAFEDCISLIEVRVDADAETFGSYAFKNCINLATMSVSKDYDPSEEVNIGKKYLAVSEGCFMNTQMTAAIPYYVEEIGNSAFEGCSITKIEFTDLTPEGYLPHLKKIGNRAFYGCEKLTSVTHLEDNLTMLDSIGEYAFAECTSLPSISIKSQVLKTISASCFENCSSMTDFICTSPIESIHERAFRKCSSLKTLFTHKSVTVRSGVNVDTSFLPTQLIKLGNEAFSGCAAVNGLTICHGESNTFSMGYRVFEGWTTQVSRDTLQAQCDIANFVRIDRKWLYSYEAQSNNNVALWGWKFLDDHTSYAWDTFERYTCPDAGNANLKFHLVAVN